MRRLGTAGAIVLLAFLASACAPKNRNLVNAKVFALNPNEFLGQRVFLSGKLAKSGPGGSFFVFADDSGKILVTTERVASPLGCPEGSSVTLSGALTKTEKSGHTYFSLDAPPECGESKK